uniref:Uncharacterized protein n=1 Tax=Globodera rostochiensis TaxID=31243 RepID=A0A914GXL2_GLORO
MYCLLLLFDGEEKEDGNVSSVEHFRLSEHHRLDRHTHYGQFGVRLNAKISRMAGFLRDRIPNKSRGTNITTFACDASACLAILKKPSSSAGRRAIATITRNFVSSAAEIGWRANHIQNGAGRELWILPDFPPPGHSLFDDGTPPVTHSLIAKSGI